MTVFEKLHPGSFKGALFFTSESTVEFGRQINEKDIANADRIVLEDASLKPRVHKMKLILAAELDDAGEELRDFFEVRDAFMAACESFGPGTLVHPEFGTIENCQAMRPVTLLHRQSELGRADVTITFKIADPERQRPVEVEDTQSEVAVANEELQDEVAGDLEGNFVDKAAGAFASAKEQLKGFTDVARGAMEKVALAKEKIDSVTTAINKFETDIVSLINNPLQLAGDFGVLFETMDSAFQLAKTAPGALRNVISRTERAIQTAISDPFDDAQRVFASFKRLGQTVSEFDPVDTHARARRKEYADTFNLSVRSSALGMQYQNAVHREFGTVEDIDATVDQLQGEFDALTDIIPEDTRQALAKVRNTALRFLAKERLRADRITTIDVLPISARQLAFRYYGSTERGQRIADLNPAQDSTLLTGDVDILTRGAGNAA